MNKNIVLCGVGGQGTVLASKLIAAAAMKKGLSVMSAETIGMAQRGGSVVTYVRYGEKVAEPVVEEGCADVLIAFERLEALRYLPYLKNEGWIVTSSVPFVNIDNYPDIEALREQREVLRASDLLSGAIDFLQKGGRKLKARNIGDDIMIKIQHFGTSERAEGAAALMNDYVRNREKFDASGETGFFLAYAARKGRDLAGRCEKIENPVGFAVVGPAQDDGART